ncbi:small ribosomal subunit protein mS39 [Petromyzon marinus]|uniref:small ribosomal subunit protein mS39 n=1 Tax=Petromyzon marinus TaxID=7757 RepID=UPI003F6FF970
MAAHVSRLGPQRHALLRVAQRSRENGFCTSVARAQQQVAAETRSEPLQGGIVIPRRKTWERTAVLRCLARTVTPDPTAWHYTLQDDRYLTPINMAEQKLFKLAQESGKNAAKYIVNNYPHLFTKQQAEPHIPGFMPQQLRPLREGASVEALQELIVLQHAQAATLVYDSLVQAGTAVPMETANRLLDLLCFYGDREPEGSPTTLKEEAAGVGVLADHEMEGESPVAETAAVEAEEEEAGAEGGESEVAAAAGPAGPTPFAQRRRGGPAIPERTWRAGNNAERIFNSMPERDAHSYCAMIQGMVKHRAAEEAFNLLVEMTNSGLKANLYAYNAIISAIPVLRQKDADRKDLLLDLLKAMLDQGVRPTVLTFNAALKALRRMGPYARTYSLAMLAEMRALGIKPSLASYHRLLNIHCRSSDSMQSSAADLISEVLEILNGENLQCQDPEDGYFFSSTMNMCLMLKDVDLAYRLNQLLETGDNWRFLSPQQHSAYYSRFFTLLCQLESMETIMEFYKRYFIPSSSFPSSRIMVELIQALDMNSRVDLIPSVWQDVKMFGHSERKDVVEEALAVMAREKHSPTVQAALSAVVLEVSQRMSPQPQEEARRPLGLRWTARSLEQATQLLVRAGLTEKAWKHLQLFQQRNLAPTEAVLREALAHLVSGRWNAEAVALVEAASALGLACAGSLAHTALAGLQLSPTQSETLNKVLADSGSSSGGSSSDDSDDSDSDKE